MSGVSNWKYGEVLILNETHAQIVRSPFDPKDGIMVAMSCSNTYGNGVSSGDWVKFHTIAERSCKFVYEDRKILRHATAKETAIFNSETAKLYLRNILKPGDCVYTSVVWYSRQSYTRRIKFYIAALEESFGTQRPAIVDITGWVAKVFKDRINKNDGGISCQEGGAAMINHLSHALFPLEGTGNVQPGGYIDSPDYRLQQRDL